MSTDRRRRTIVRLAAALRLELRVELRARIPAVAVGLVAAWTVLLLVVPPRAASALGPYILIVDTATFGTFFIAALYLLERGEGSLIALKCSPLRFGEYLGIKLATLTGLSVAVAMPIAAAAGRASPGDLAVRSVLLLLGVGLAAALILALSFLLALPRRSLTGFLTTTPLLVAPLLATPLAYLAGLFDHPLAFIVPTTGAAALIRVAITAEQTPLLPHTLAIAAYLLVWIAGTIALARTRFDRERDRPAPSRASAPRVGPARARRGWVRSFAWTDLRSIRMEMLLVMVLGAPILLAAAIRYGYGPVTEYLYGRYGLELDAHNSLVFALLVTVHVPIIIGMIGSLLVLDDIDDRRLLLLRVTPVTVTRYLRYRIASTSIVTLAGLLLAVPLSGLATAPLPRLLPALLLASAQASLIMLAVAAFANNKVQGLALLKVLGGAVMLAASTPWWVPPTAGWPLYGLPPTWVTFTQRAAETGAATHVLAGLCAGTAVTTVTGLLLARRTITKITT